MEGQKIQKILSELYKEFDIYPDDEQYKNYLTEKIIKAYGYEKKYNISEKEFLTKIKGEVPNFINQYKRLKSGIDNMSQSNDSSFGISISFQLIDLFDIAKMCNNNEEFQIQKQKYFNSLASDKRFSGFDYVFPGLKEVNFEQIRNIENNICNNVDCITPEWMGKMRAIIDIEKPVYVDGDINDEIFNFDYLDKVANFARQHNMKFRMHNIIWHKDFMPIFDNMSRDEILYFLNVYMNKINSRYGDIMYAVDVLNEIASDTSDKILRDSKWKTKLGEDYYIDILKIAKKIFEDIPLFYNEYGEERTEKRKNILSIVNKIKQEEEKNGIILLDGLGIQSHYSNVTQDQDIKQAYLDLTQTGKQLQITELDVSNDGTNKQFDYDSNRVFRTVLDCASTLGIKIMNMWGISSSISWKKDKINTFLDSDGNISQYSSLIVKTYKKKIKEEIKTNSSRK
mgnify:FL=1